MTRGDGEPAGIDTRPAVTIVVVTYNSARWIEPFLASLPDGLGGIDSWSLVLADNASTDGTVALVEAGAPDAVVVRLDANRGYAAGVNAALAAVPPREAAVVLNPDIRLHPGCIAALLAALREPGVGIAVPRLLESDGSLQHSLRREPSVVRALGEAVLGGKRAGRFSPLGEVVRNPRRYEAPGFSAWASGAAMALSRRCLDEVGWWDESFFLYSEETEYALRAADRGLRLRYTPAAVAVHVGGDVHVDPHLWALLVVNRLRLFRRRNGRVRSVLFHGALVLNELLRAPFAATHRAGLSALFSNLDAATGEQAVRQREARQGR